MTSDLFNEIKKIIEPLLKTHAELMKEFIPAKAGFDIARADELSKHIEKVEKAIRDLENASTNDELKIAINNANAIFTKKKS